MNRSSHQKKLCQLFNIELPIIQAGMVWVSGAKLAAASAESGILGVIGAASMAPDLLRTHIRKAKSLTKRSLAVNIPLLYSKTEEQIQVALEEGIRIFITSAGSPKIHTPGLKAKGCVVVHVVASPKLAKKCEEAGVDAVVAEGFEAGGHNGRDELTTFTLIPQVVQAVRIPVIAAGGIGSGQGVAAAFALGAHGAQLGTRFAMTQESSAHQNFKTLLTQADSEATMLCMKRLVPVRLVKNAFYQQVHKLEESCASDEELKSLLGKGRAKLGMFDGDLSEGELEIGQVCGLLKDIPRVSEVVASLKREYNETLEYLVGPI